MNNIYKMTIFFTNICNAKCEHCYVNPLFINKEIMSNSLLNDCINSAIQFHIKRISLTGGEPLLFWNEISKNMNNIKDNNIDCSISTNAYWADSDVHAHKFITEMKSKGVNCLEVSTDKYHQKFIPLENIIRCIKSSQYENMSILVRVCGENINDEMRTLNILSSLLKNKKHLIFQYTANYGSAKSNSIHSNLDYKSLKDIKCMQIGQPIIMYNGDVYACCGPSISSYKKNGLYLGKFSKENSQQIFTKLKNSELVKQLQQLGPASLFNNDNCKKQYSSLCELCNEAIDERNLLIMK